MAYSAVPRTAYVSTIKINKAAANTAGLAVNIIVKINNAAEADQLAIRTVALTSGLAIKDLIVLNCLPVL
jgi:hypothetical protein